MPDSPADTRSANSAHVREESTGIPDLNAPLTHETHLLTKFLLDRREKELRAGRHKQADRLLRAAWEAYFRGK